MNLLERVADALPVSIGLDAPTLLAFKSHCGLPVDAAWTESDGLLQSYLTAAERQVDELSGMPYRLRNFTLSVEQLERYCGGPRQTSVSRYCFTTPVQFWCIKFPMRPVATSPAPTISYIDDSGNSGTYTSGTDFSTIAPNSISPMAIFPYSFQPPRTATVPYPFTLSFSAGGGVPDAAIARTCIFEYAAAYYRNPEMAGKELSYVSQVFDANLTALLGSFL